MSNLNLPNMSYESLVNRKPGKIAYETTLTHKRHGVTGEVLECQIRHHGNLIARISPDNIEISNCGWHSPTTANRLSTITADNRAGSVGIKDGMMEFFTAWTRGPRGGLKRHNPISVGSYFLKIGRNSVTFPMPEV